MKLYEITTIDGGTVEYSIPVREAAKIVNRSVGSVQQAALEERIVNKKYRIRPVDQVLSPTKDAALLIEYDLVRKEILGKYKQQ